MNTQTDLVSFANRLLADPQQRQTRTRVEYSHLGVTYSATFPGLLTRDQLEQRLIMEHHRFVRRSDFVSVSFI